MGHTVHASTLTKTTGVIPQIYNEVMIAVIAVVVISVVQVLATVAVINNNSSYLSTIENTLSIIKYSLTTL